MSDGYDVIVIGAGHNGLCCAAYLARAGRNVLVLEGANEIGGAAATREFAPGYRVSACAHILHMLSPAVIADLELAKHGLSLSADGLDTHALSLDGRSLRINGAELDGEVGAKDRTALREFHQQMARFARMLMPHFEKRPPRLVGGTLSDKLSLVKLGWDIRRLGRDEMRELMRIGAINIYDVLQERFESELLKGAIGLDATLGTHLGPRSPNSVLTYLYRMTGQVQGRQGALALAKGGMGSVTAALASAAEDRGVSIRTGAPVAHISVQEGRLTGVQLESGEFVPAPVVSSSADPKRTLLGLLGAQHLETGFVRRVTNLRMQGNAAKLHLALEDLPHFSGLSQKESGGRLVIAPNLNYLERAFDHAKYGQYSPAPALEITIPTLHEQTLAPDCKHVLSAVVQYAPYRLKQGWNAGREKFQQLVIDRIAEYAPSLKEMIVASELLTPEDIEREFLITGGHWHHGELTLDQFMMLRPVPGAAQYSTPIPGLYLCGAGSHPGGGVMGLAGRNAAHEISSNGPGEGEV